MVGDKAKELKILPIFQVPFVSFLLHTHRSEERRVGKECKRIVLWQFSL